MNLTDEQKGKIEEINSQFEKDIAPINAQVKVKAIDLEKLWKEEILDAGKIIKKSREIWELQSKIQEKLIYRDIEILKILTPEQRKIYLENKMIFQEKCPMEKEKKEKEEKSH